MNQFSASPDILTTISTLSSSMWAYAGLSAAFELDLARELGTPSSVPELSARTGLDADLVADLLDVLVALGAVEGWVEGDGEVYVARPEFETFRDGSLGRVTEAGIRSDHLQIADALCRARAGELRPGWDHSDPDVLVAQGETAGLFRLSAEHVLPSLAGLRESLERPGSRFLDVGAGVGVISAELCLVYPEVTADCLEPNAEARRIGRDRVAAAGLAGRIAFHDRGVEDLDARDRYDLALMPQPFLHPGAFEAGLRRVRTALRPGGWMLVLALDVPVDDPLAAAAARMRARLWGGGAASAEELTARLGAAGLEGVRADPPVGGYRMLAARRGVAAATAKASVAVSGPGV
jgi:SAM-dependent methyltransferase